MDPDHAMKLSDVGVERPPHMGSSRRAGGGRNKRIMSIMLRAVLCLALGYALALAVLVGYIAAAGGSIIYDPEAASACVVGCTELTCCDYETTLVNYTNVSFDSEGATLNGWFMSSPDSAPTPRVPMLYNHGLGKNIAVRYRVERYAFLLSLGVDLFTYDYPGYGKSTGSPSESGLYAASLAAYQELESRVSAPASSTVILGRSLGGSVAVNLATQYTDVKSQGMILQSTYASLAEVAAAGFPVLGWAVEAAFPERYDSADKIGPYTGCLFDSHSTKDEWVDYEFGTKLYDAATSVPTASTCKVFVETTTLHDDPMTQAEKDALTAWVNQRRLNLAP